MWDNVHAVANVARDPQAKELLCFLNQEKAYNRVDWRYMSLAFNHARLDKKFIRWARRFSSLATMCITSPDFRTQSIIPERA